MDAHLHYAEEACLPHGLDCMVAQVLIIIRIDDGRELPNSVLRILAKEDGALLRDGTMARHQTLPFLRTRRRRQSDGQRCLSNG